MGAAIYWAEGTKAKPWHPEERVKFVNSDPAMICLFLEFLKIMGVDESRLRFHLSIHENADVAASEAFWRRVVKADADRFHRTTLKRHQPRTNRRNVGAGYHGCLSVTVTRSVDLYRQIEGIWWAVSGQSASSLGDRSAVG